MLGIGGAFYAAYIGVRMIAKEESDHTAEFLLAHPLGRSSVVAGKLLAVVVCVVVLNACAAVCAIGSFVFIDEPLDFEPFWLFMSVLCMHARTSQRNA